MLKGSSKFSGSPQGGCRRGMGWWQRREGVGKSWVGEQLTRTIAKSAFFYLVKHFPAVLVCQLEGAVTK